jgi:hydroxymethylpyrimidine/phosphomethylpyrimidine kinase
MPRIDTVNVHGSGDTLSAAIATRLAEGYSLYNAIEFATQFTYNAIKRAQDWEIGEGHGPLAHFC